MYCCFHCLRGSVLVLVLLFSTLCPSSVAITLMEKRWPVVFYTLPSWCLVTVSVLRLISRYSRLISGV